MMVVDTSALMAIILDEPPAGWLERQLQSETGAILISAGTIAECLIVAVGRRTSAEMELLLGKLGHTVVPVDEIQAAQIGKAYARWAKGFHPAGLNFGDCFAYVLAMDHDCPLLFVGNDFSRTDVKAVLANQGDPA
jgi:ribonuclease VapC